MLGARKTADDVFRKLSSFFATYSESLSEWWNLFQLLFGKGRDRKVIEKQLNEYTCISDILVLFPHV